MSTAWSNPRVSLLHEVEELESGRPVVLGDRDDEAQVRHDERVTLRISVACPAGQLAARSGPRSVGRAELLPRLRAGFDALSQFHLVAFGQERMTADVDEVQVDQSSSSYVAWRDVTMSTFRTTAPRHRP
jgi:hypothetical protein